MLRIVTCGIAALLFGIDCCHGGTGLFQVAETGEKPVLDTPVPVAVVAEQVQQQSAPVGCANGDCTATVTLSCPKCETPAPVAPVMMQSVPMMQTPLCGCDSVQSSVPFALAPVQSYVSLPVMQSYATTPVWGNVSQRVASSGFSTPTGYQFPATNQRGVAAWDMDEDGGIWWDTDPPRRRMRVIRRLIQKRGAR